LGPRVGVSGRNLIRLIGVHLAALLTRIRWKLIRDRIRGKDMDGSFEAGILNALGREGNYSRRRLPQPAMRYSPPAVGQHLSVSRPVRWVRAGFTAC